MKLARYILKRLALLIPQLLLVTVVAFLLIRLLPGNPAEALAGPNRTPEAIRAIEAEMGLNGSLPHQFWSYLSNVLQGDLGFSWFTGQDVSTDLSQRAPATIELILYSLIVALVVGMLLGVAATMASDRIVGRASNFAIRFAGSLPDFWIALVAIFIFFHVLGIAPAPLGRLSIQAAAPPEVTGLYTVDCAIAGDASCFGSAVSHLALPVIVLGGILSLIVGRVARASLLEVNRGAFIAHARNMGLPPRTIARYAVRNATPAVVTVGGVLVAYLLGGAVLIEQVFSWGGVGQYAVEAVSNADYFAVQGFLLVAAAFTIFVYLIVDIVHMAIDPRVRLDD